MATLSEKFSTFEIMLKRSLQSAEENVAKAKEQIGSTDSEHLVGWGELDRLIEGQGTIVATAQTIQMIESFKAEELSDEEIVAKLMKQVIRRVTNGVSLGSSSTSSNSISLAEHKGWTNILDNLSWF